MLSMCFLGRSFMRCNLQNLNKTTYKQKHHMKVWNILSFSFFIMCVPEASLDLSNMLCVNCTLFSLLEWVFFFRQLPFSFSVKSAWTSFSLDTTAAVLLWWCICLQHFLTSSIHSGKLEVLKVTQMYMSYLHLLIQKESEIGTFVSVNLPLFTIPA